jgi:hypothetical protein
MMPPSYRFRSLRILMSAYRAYRASLNALMQAVAIGKGSPETLALLGIPPRKPDKPGGGK